MIKYVLSILVFAVFISCNRTFLKNNTYYNTSSSEIYYFEDSSLKIYNIKDSTYKKNNYFIDNSIIFFNKKKYNILKRKDTLILSNNIDGENKLKLVKIEFHKINIEKLKNIYYQMKVEKINRENDKEYWEEQFLTIDSTNSLRAYFKQNNDTLYGMRYNPSGLYFDKFPTYKTGLIHIILANFSNDILNIIIFNSENKSKSYTLKSSNIQNISGQKPLFNFD